MSARAMEKDFLPSQPKPVDALGALVTPKLVERFEEPVLVLRKTSISSDRDEAVLNRAGLATDIKEMFQAIKGVSGDERDTERAYLREASIYHMFKDLKMLDEAETTDVFDSAYGDVDAIIDTFDRETLSSLADKYEGHPLIRTLTTLRGITSESMEEDVVRMKRVSLVMIDRYTVPS